MKSKTVKALIGGSVAAVMALSISLPSQADAASGTTTAENNPSFDQFVQYFAQYSNKAFYFNGDTVTVSKFKPPVVPQKTAAPAATATPAPTAKPAATAAPAATAKPAATPAATAAPAATASTQSSYVKQVVDLVNKERAAAGLSPVAALDSLNKVAAAKATDMRVNNYFSHTSPTYGSPFDMMKSFGITYRAAGENIAMGQKSPQEVMTAWMNSAGHRANILSANFNYIGVGYDNNYWVQEFIGK
ncbi:MULTISPECIES: CAP domain-containing protein [unclassified Paenibacillus]|uniref:CAP domain-containing protein n=1 Tax=unclassified Paenibacillus TaxID=185978 RepID=UPI0024059441|nr:MULTISPECIES: CAP domain-containing protein [unclassified Paenibacillus]MDF9844822.1 putative YkwD family protein [Paenibacillus sp. PastF-2]MDF9851424.1 putative YkwD family protein [Paenibacillus sp. PastM-2]MDF9858047.1 putative YkwD family protein [Paenibacillus sp. PastF-1]MDH6483314.1 putative YkwD family protein [Paenibacillus sp. PastH-2]MDH6510723.1 putative YkwD family protein [Paenibacillus sp. PastM-3]